VKLVSTTEMQQVEREANENGLTYEMMMEHAGLGLAEQITAEYGDQKDGGIFGLVGSGNNGGDTLVALAKLSDWGWKATAYIVRARPEDDPLVERVRSSGGILGTGIKLPLRGTVKDVLIITKKSLSQMEMKPSLVAVDCPSGVDCDSGESAEDCLAADMTVTMAAVKQG